MEKNDMDKQSELTEDGEIKSNEASEPETAVETPVVGNQVSENPKVEEQLVLLKRSSSDSSSNSSICRSSQVFPHKPYRSLKHHRNVIRQFRGEIRKSRTDINKYNRTIAKYRDDIKLCKSTIEKSYGAIRQKEKDIKMFRNEIERNKLDISTRHNHRERSKTVSSNSSSEWSSNDRGESDKESGNGTWDTRASAKELRQARANKRFNPLRKPKKSILQPRNYWTEATDPDIQRLSYRSFRSITLKNTLLNTVYLNSTPPEPTTEQSKSILVTPMRGPMFPRLQYMYNQFRRLFWKNATLESDTNLNAATPYPIAAYTQNGVPIKEKPGPFIEPKCPQTRGKTVKFAAQVCDIKKPISKKRKIRRRANRRRNRSSTD